MSEHRARKRFGQHFLVDPVVIDQLIAAIDPQSDDEMIEIGPGQGALTTPLSGRVHRLTLVEIDRDLIEGLKQRYGGIANLSIVQGDALELDLDAVSGAAKLRVVGNLPYNITSPLLIRLLGQLDRIKDMCFMLQKEVVDRICAAPGSGTYGRLSVMIQSRCSAASVLEVAPAAFAPPPKVDSSVLRLWPLAVQPSAPDIANLAEITRLAFSMRRKMIKKTLQSRCGESMLRACGIDPSARPQDISVAAYLELARAVQ